jgi:endonuclease YncB( thermonuclease family)
MFEMAVIAILLALWLGEIGERNRYELSEVTVHDGDTITARINLGWRISIKEHIRAADYDAWEITKTRRTVEVTDDEIAKGKAAKSFVETFAGDNNHQLFVVGILRGEGRDVYGRILGEIWCREKNGEWINLGDLMREKGHVRK